MTTLLAFVFVLGVLVFFHEAGHFLSAKWLKVKVNVFSLGFPPKLVGRKWGDTEYQIGLLPIGGYVKMAGDNPLEATGNPEEFMSRSKLERLVILYGPNDEPDIGGIDLHRSLHGGNLTAFGTRRPSRDSIRLTGLARWQRRS